MSLLHLKASSRLVDRHLRGMLLHPGVCQSRPSHRICELLYHLVIAHLSGKIVDADGNFAITSHCGAGASSFYHSHIQIRSGEKGVFVGQQPLMLLIIQGIHHPDSLLDGADSIFLSAGMTGLSLKLHLKEHKSHMCQNQLIAGALAHYYSVGPLAAHNSLHGTVSSALLVADRGDYHIARQL